MYAEDNMTLYDMASIRSHPGVRDRGMCINEIDRNLGGPVLPHKVVGEIKP